MSRLGKKPVAVSDKVKAELKNNVLEVTGPLGKVSQYIDPVLDVKIEKGQITLSPKSQTKENNTKLGLYRGLVTNAVEGVTSGFKKELEIIGLGYKAVQEGKNIVMSVGFSHTVTVSVPEGIKVILGTNADKQTTVTITGLDKQLVGQFAAAVRLVKKPEPYQGFGVRYLGERIIRKAGKAASAGAKK